MKHFNGNDIFKMNLFSMISSTLYYSTTLKHRLQKDQFRSDNGNNVVIMAHVNLK